MPPGFELSAIEIAGMTEYERLKFTEMKFSHWDEEPGGDGQAARLRVAVRDVMGQLVPPKPSFQDEINANMKLRALRQKAQPMPPISDLNQDAPLLPSESPRFTGLRL